ncbi:mucin-17 [Bicyclus anynana]|uniref:Mucin-17 n=1 Tax=Bicyclus anynana TaxID=110368 RepID=A0ABM3LIJ1_BICAN|nr:mucin-17 [Bicyclus anynana]
MNTEGSQSRIVSGWEALPGQHPHQVSLRMVNPLGSVSRAANTGVGRVTIVVRAGLVSLLRPEMIVETTSYYNHPTFDSTRPTVVQPNDIALLELPIKLEYSRNLQPIRIQPSAHAFRNYENLVVHTSGFGRTWTNGKVETFLCVCAYSRILIRTSSVTKSFSALILDLKVSDCTARRSYHGGAALGVPARRVQPHVRRRVRLRHHHRHHHLCALLQRHFAVHLPGEGTVTTVSSATEELRWVYLRAVSNPTCAGVFGSGIITATTICARYFNVTSQSTCQGDSGGPLVHVDEQGVPVLVGVSSFVAGEPFGCHSGLPAGFARPGPFHAWYRDVTGLDFENLNEEEDDTTSTTTTTTTTTTTPTTTTPTTTTPTTTTPTTTTPTTTTPTTTTPTTTTPTTTTPTTTTPTTTTPTTTTPASTTPTTSTPTTVTPTTTSSTPTITTSAPSTTTYSTTTTTPFTTTYSTTPRIPPTPPTTPPIPSTTPPITPDGDDDEDDDPEVSELLKRLDVKVKVLVSLSKNDRVRVQ